MPVSCPNVRAALPLRHPFCNSFSCALNLSADMNPARRVHRDDGYHGYLAGHHHALACQGWGRAG
ncbi:MAG: hypothetical protein V3S14_02090 [Anaerolineae bacterium]